MFTYAVLDIMDRAVNNEDIVPALWSFQFSMKITLITDVMTVIQKEVQDVMGRYGQGSFLWGGDTQAKI